MPWHKSEPHIPWTDIKKIIHFSGYVLGIAQSMGIKVRWGGDWDSDFDLEDQHFMDYAHFEV